MLFRCLVAKSSPILCDPLDCSLPGSSVHGIFQARIQEWVAFPSPGDLPHPGIKPMSPASPALPSGFFTATQPGKPILSTDPCTCFLLIHVPILYRGWKAKKCNEML